MTATRRVYLYLVSFAGLAMVAAGLANLLSVLVTLLLSADVASSARDDVSRWGATALVGLPVWLLHWTWAQRGAARSLDERSSTLRRLYVYAVLVGATLAMAAAAHAAVQGALAGEGQHAAERVPTVLVGLVLWVFHWRVADRDREVAGEAGGSATLRRWYTYGAAYLGFVLLVDGCRLVVEGLWLSFFAGGGSPTALAGGVASALVGLILWLAHSVLLPRSAGRQVVEQDRRSTLLAVYLFLGLVLVVGRALAGASQLLYYALGRLLGIAQPGGVGGDLVQAAAGPAADILVFGIGWAYQRHAIEAQARLVEAPRQASVRRLYTYLVALLGLAAWAVGLGGLLWTAADALTNGDTTHVSGWWRDSAALFATLAIVGLPVWLLHWRPHVGDDLAEARSLSRRLYLYVTLIAGVLALLGSAATTAYRLLSLVLGTALSGSIVTDLTRALAVVAVALLLVVYHWRALRVDAARGTVTPPLPNAAAVSATVRLRAVDAAGLRLALDALADCGVAVEVLAEESLGTSGRDVLREQTP